MRLILIITILLIPSLSFATQKAYYCSATNTHIIDVSGKKTLDQIKKDSGDCNYDVISIDESFEAVRVKNGVLEKYDFKKENKNKSDAKKANKNAKKALIKTKLGLNESEWKDLKEALGVK